MLQYLFTSQNSLAVYGGYISMDDWVGGQYSWEGLDASGQWYYWDKDFQWIPVENEREAILLEPRWYEGEEIAHLCKPYNQPKRFEHDPMFKNVLGYFWWDETWSRCFGPFPTAYDAKESLTYYCVNVLGV